MTNELNLYELHDSKLNEPISLPSTNTANPIETVQQQPTNATNELKSGNSVKSSFKWCCLRPDISWKFTFACLCVCCFFENLVTSGVATVVLSTLEREFFWSSTQSGLFLALFELAAFIASPVFGFLGE